MGAATSPPHAVLAADGRTTSSTDVAKAPGYAELHCLSNFSFGRGASSADELFARAARLGYAALAITDECSLAGIVRALEASEKHAVPLIVGSDIRFVCGTRLLLLCAEQAGYTRLCQLITRGRRAAGKGAYRLTLDDLAAVGTDGLLGVWLPEDAWREAALPPADARQRPGSRPRTGSGAVGDRKTHGPASERPALRPGDGDAAGVGWMPALIALAGHFPCRLWIGVALHHEGDDAAKLGALRALSAITGLPQVACGEVHMHVRRRRALQDALTAIRLNLRVDAAGHALFRNGERHLRPIETLATLYPPDLLAESLAIARRCRFSLRQLRYRYPRELVPQDTTPSAHLRALTAAGAHERWPAGLPDGVRALIEKELALIAELEYEAFFLTVHDVVAWARSRGILCQGRGSAANSVVCYCLGITAISPERIHMLFERFISKERDEPPDIDVDFEHQRREEVIQYIYAKYGRERAALAATVICYRSKSAARDLGRVLGFSDDQLEQFARVFARGNSKVEREALLREYGFDPEAPEIRRFLILFDELRGFPRHLSQHVGGFVIADETLASLVPVENAAMPERTIIQWDKDDLETLGLLKVDCLALGMLSCLRRCIDLIHRHRGIQHTLATIPEGDAATYAMIQRGDTLGVFQIESRAQMAMLPRLRPADFYDLVIEVAIVRPGPIQGDMVHPYLRRRCGEEPVEFANPLLEKVLGRTLGVPIFQEQVMHLAIVAAGFSPGEADQLRRSMAAWKRHGGLEHWHERVVGGMLERGYADDFAERIFEQIKGFGSYGFPESHAASFALIAYVSAYLKCHEPAAYACALLNSQPMGFYPPSQIVADARRHDVVVRPVDVLASEWECTLEGPAQDSEDQRERGLRAVPNAASPTPAPMPGLTLRLGLQQIRGLSAHCAQRIAAARMARDFSDVQDLVDRAGLARDEREKLASAGALKRLAGHRHRAFWQIAGSERHGDLLAGSRHAEVNQPLPLPSRADDTFADYAATGLTLGTHPLQLVRPQLRARRIRCASELAGLRDGLPVRVAGLVTMRQRPATATGVTFVTLEDESGLINLVVWAAVAARQRRPLIEASLLGVDGVLQRQHTVIHVIAGRLHDYSALLDGLDTRSRDFH